ncbi:MAG: ABC transporter permease [Clostridia bacterium]|nr:ABC transporter permease [Clostridia bacterium]
MHKTPGKRLARTLPPLAGIAVVLLVWHLACSIGHISSYVLPSPQKVGSTFMKMAASGEISRDILVSFSRVLRGFSIAFALAFLLALLRIALPASDPYLAPFVQFFRNVPPISMIPLLILWCGIGETTKTVIIVLAAFFPMYLAIVKGFTSYDPKLLEVARVFHYTWARTFLRVILPSALPDILLGMRTSLGYAWRAIIGAEMVAASTGLGHMILFAQQMSRTDKVIVGILIIGLTGLITDWLLGLLINRLAGRRAQHGWD